MVYNAVDKDSLENLIGIHSSPHPQCPIGKYIYTILKNPYNKIREAIQKKMDAFILQMPAEDYQELNLT